MPKTPLHSEYLLSSTYNYTPTMAPYTQNLKVAATKIIVKKCSCLIQECATIFERRTIQPLEVEC